MSEGKAHNSIDMSDYEILYLIKDLLEYVREQQTSIYGRTTGRLDEISRTVEGQLESVLDIVSGD